MEGLDLSKFSDEQLEALSKGDYSTLTEEQLKHLSDVHEANRKPEERRAEERYVENPVNPLVTGAVGAATGPAVGYMTEKYKQGVAEHRIAPKGSVTVEITPSGIVPSAAQHEQIITGGTDASGTTGRARQQGYNENTALQARNAEIAEQNAARVRAMGLPGTAQDPFAAVGTRVTSTPTGIIAPASTVYSPPAAGAPASLMERLSQAYPEIKAGLSKVASSGAMPYIGRAITGAGTGLSLADTINRLKAHDYLGAGLSAIQTGAAGATMFQPELAPVTVPLGLGAAGAQYLYDNPEALQKAITPENTPMMAAGGQIAIKTGGLVALKKKKK